MRGSLDGGASARLALEGVELCRWQSCDLAGWRFDAPAGATLNGTALRTGELARGDQLCVADLDLTL